MTIHISDSVDASLRSQSRFAFCAMHRSSWWRSVHPSLASEDLNTRTRTDTRMGIHRRSNSSSMDQRRDRSTAHNSLTRNCTGTRVLQGPHLNPALSQNRPIPNHRDGDHRASHDRHANRCYYRRANHYRPHYDAGRMRYWGCYQFATFSKFLAASNIRRSFRCSTTYAVAPPPPWCRSVVVWRRGPLLLASSRLASTHR